MENPQSMFIKTKEKGFSLIECLIVMLLISSLSIFSIKSLNTITGKVKNVDITDKYVELINGFTFLIYECDNYNIKFLDNKAYFMYYPISSDYRVGDFPGEETKTDIMAYDKVCDVYLNSVFSKITGFENGVYEYEPVNNFTGTLRWLENIITYTCEEGVVNVTIELNKTGTRGYEWGWFKTVEYIDKTGLSRTFQI